MGGGEERKFNSNPLTPLQPHNRPENSLLVRKLTENFPSRFARKLFRAVDPVGQELRAGKHYYRVGGLLGAGLALLALSGAPAAQSASIEPHDPEAAHAATLDDLRQSLENAMVVTMALGGSTNAVLHLIAIARAFELELTIDDWLSVADRVPVLQ
mgnify:CR=1 FL=1